MWDASGDRLPVCHRSNGDAEINDRVDLLPDFDLGRDLACKLLL